VADDRELDEPRIDFIFCSPDGQEYVLVLVEERPWDMPGVLDHLAGRIEMVAGYVLEGGLATEFPETRGKAVRVHVDHLVPADPDAEALFLRATDLLGRQGLPFTAEQLHEPAEGAPDEPGGP
jgi:hypothetical protein